MIMVVAMLSMLFVVGVAFLATVTFESRSVAGAKKAKQQASVVESLSREVRRALIRSFLGNDGLPWNRDSEPTGLSPIGNDISGEIPGVHPLLASIEPFDPDGDPPSPWFFFSATDLDSAINEVAVNQAVPGVQVDSAFRTNPPYDESKESHTDPSSSKFYRRDADGDGVWDSFEYLLPGSRYPASVRGELGDELKTDEADENEIYYAVRVIPHGAMVDVGHAHKTLLDGLFALAGETGTVGGPYVAEGEEILLRRRGLIPPRDLPLSSLQSRPTAGQIPWALYVAFVVDFDDFSAGNEDPRWWPIATGQDGDFSGEEVTGTWVPWMNPDPVNPDDYNYDVRHLLTTVSHDDQLMRMGRNANSPIDWIEDIMGPPNGTLDPDDFEIDEWPDAGNADNPLNGRLKVSLPGLVDRIIADYNVNNDDISTLGELLVLGAGNPYYDRFVVTIQDAFLLMLRNVDDAQWPPLPAITKAQAAAALTANLIDFVDDDAEEEPTKVEIRKESGARSDVYVYGLERQPYITELYADNVDDTPAFSVYAIELFNPYSKPIDLSGYSLVDKSDDPPSPLNEPLGSNTILPQSYIVFTSNKDTPAGPDGATQLGAVNSWQLTQSSQVQLIRKVDPDNVVADRFDASGGGNFGVMNQGGISLQRMTGVVADTGGWTALVPFYKVYENGEHTMNLGARDNVFESSSIRPVQIDFANTGDMATAFRTTGTLLLLSRYANESDTAPDPEPFTAQLIADKGEIDNGRMPVFDQEKKAQPDPDLPPSGTDTPFDLNIPWGQLVFDYFTALPLRNIPGEPDYDEQLPQVDQGGLRVHGRININAAPWTVLAGLPLIPMDWILSPFRAQIEDTVFPGVGSPDPAQAQPVGAPLAQSIVAYREARQMGNTGDFSAGVSGVGDRFRDDGSGAAFSGFLTVGELANVRRPGGGGGPYDIDSGVIDGSANEDYVKAVAVLVALGDWVTTRSHVFTVYGTLRGSGTKSAVDEKAIRFQETVDRLPSFFNKNRLPRRIGPRSVGPYAQSSRD